MDSPSPPPDNTTDTTSQQDQPIHSALTVLQNSNDGTTTPLIPITQVPANTVSTPPSIYTGPAVVTEQLRLITNIATKMDKMSDSIDFLIKRDTATTEKLEKVEQ